MTRWLDDTRPLRCRIAVSGGPHGQDERVATLKLPVPVFDPILIEVDSGGKALGPEVWLQSDGDQFLFHLRGCTPAGATRHYQVYFDERDRGEGGRTHASGPVSLTAGLEHEGFAALRVETPGCSWLYHLHGGGFAGLLDDDGADWISYHPWGGSDGNYRGIPNLVHPESYFHPGRESCSSEVVNAGPLRVTIRSRSNDDRWKCEWRIEPDCARLTVLRAARPYWLLYEGTPGGCLDEQGDYLLLSDGRRINAAERLEVRRLPEPGWIAFGAAGNRRALWLLRHEPDGDADSYWPMEGNMTVFGFGRSGLKKSLTRVPAHFSVGLAARNDYDTLARSIAASRITPEVSQGPVERR